MDFALLDSLIISHGSSRAGLMLLIVGGACLGSPTLLIHHLTFGPSLLIQMMARASSSLSTLARTRIGLLALISGHVSLASAPSTRMLSQSGLLMLLVEFMNMDSLLFMRGPLRIGFLLLVLGRV